MAPGAGPLRERYHWQCGRDRGQWKPRSRQGCYPRAGLRMVNSVHRQKAGAFKDASYPWGPWARPH